MNLLCRTIAAIFLSCAFAGADTTRESLVNLCDPKKSSAVGQRQRDLGERFFNAGLLLKTGLDALATK